MNRNGNGGEYRGQEDTGPVGELPGFGGLSLDDPEEDTRQGAERTPEQDTEQKTQRPRREPEPERRVRKQPLPQDPDSPLQKFITQEEEKKRNASGSKPFKPSEDEAIINISPAFLLFVGVAVVVVIAGYLAVNQLIDVSLGGSGTGAGGDESAEVAESEGAGEGEAEGGNEAEGNPGEGAAAEGGEPADNAAGLLADATGAERALVQENTTETGISYAFSGAAVSPGSSDSEELEISASGDAGEEWSGERAVDTSARQNVVSVTLEGPTIATYAGTISGNEQTLYGSFAQRVSDVTAYASVQSYESTAEGEEAFSVGGVYNYEEPSDGRIAGSFTDTVQGESEDGTQMLRLYTERDAEGDLYRQFAATYELGNNFPVPALVGWESGAGE